MRSHQGLFCKEREKTATRTFTSLWQRGLEGTVDLLPTQQTGDQLGHCVGERPKLSSLHPWRNVRDHTRNARTSLGSGKHHQLFPELHRLGFQKRSLPDSIV